MKQFYPYLTMLEAEQSWSREIIGRDT